MKLTLALASSLLVCSDLKSGGFFRCSGGPLHQALAIIRPRMQSMQYSYRVVVFFALESKITKNSVQPPEPALAIQRKQTHASVAALRSLAF